MMTYVWYCGQSGLKPHLKTSWKSTYTPVWLQSGVHRGEDEPNRGEFSGSKFALSIGCHQIEDRYFVPSKVWTYLVKYLWDFFIKVLDEPDKKEPKKGRQLLPGGFAGTGPNGSFFEAPAWVDQSKAPGTTSQVRHLQPGIIVYLLFIKIPKRETLGSFDWDPTGVPRGITLQHPTLGHP